jgi:hypothetical protein
MKIILHRVFLLLCTANVEMTKLTTRALSSIRGFFGPDSDECERAGGMRKSERMN